jgi:hypothetical protein
MAGMFANISTSNAQDTAGDELEESQDQLDFAGDLRTSLARNKRRERDESEDATYTPTLRIRYGFTAALAPNIEFKARAAGLFTKDTDGISLRAQGPIETGDITVDSMFLRFKPSPAITIDLGRLQTAFELDSVVEDSLSRHDSSGTAVDWTNGIHAIVGSEESYRIHFIAQRNTKNGSTNAVGTIGPVSFEDKDSRVTYYVGLQLPPTNFITQFIADVTVIPDALRPLGLENTRSANIVAATLKAAADFTVGKRTVHPFLELGATLTDTQKEVRALSGAAESAGRMAVVSGFDVMEIGPGDLGIQAAWVQAGFIISPDYPANAFSVEVRHRTRFGENAVFEIRYRHREDINKTVNPVARVDHNVQLRFTLEF